MDEMKKRLFVLPAAAVLAALLSFVCFAAEKVVFSPDAPCRVVVAEDAGARERYAAETLVRYLEEIVGEAPALVTDAETADGAEIAVGDTNRGAPDLTDVSAGGYRIAFSGDALCIRGKGAKGCANGVFAFLRDCCGCRWYTDTVRVIPQRSALSLPADFDVSYTPYFEYTETDWLYGPFDAEYSLANGLNGSSCRYLSPEQGGNVQYLPRLAHSLTSYFCSADTYFETHPEYFALHDGKRTPEQVCLTNPDVLALVTRETLDLLSVNHDPDADVQIVSVTQADNGSYCECAACKALDDANGSHAGTMVTFINAVADAVKAAGYDNVLLDTFAYQYTRTPPSAVVPRDNVIIRLCSIECCFCHALDDEKCKENCSFMADLRGWNDICKRIYIWDYTTNYWETICIYPDFGVLQKNMQLFYENHARGVFEEGNACRDCDAEFAELRAYLLARLMQNPYLDFDAEMRGFLQAYYGGGWEPIYNFLSRVTEKAGASRTAHLGTFPHSTKTLTRFTAADVKYADAQWEEAKEATAGTEFYLRVERSELCWRYWKCTNRKSEFSLLRTPYKRMLAKETLYRDLVRFGVGKINDTRRLRTLTECRSIILLRPADKWCALYENGFWDMLTPLTERLYDLLRRIETPIYVK